MRAILDSLTGSSTDIDHPMPDRQPLDLDRALAMLSTPRRRHLVDIIGANAGPYETRTLAEVVARRQFGEPVESQERKRVYVSLYQSHLPKLVEAGVLVQEGEHEYRRGPAFGQVEIMLQRARAVAGGEVRA